MIRPFLLVLIALLGIGCGSADQVVEYTASDAEFRFEGPLFSGPQSAQAVLAVDIQRILDSLGKTREDIDRVELVGADLNADSLAFANLNSLTLQFTGDQSPMVQAGVLNPVPQGMSAAFTPATEADLGAVFREGICYALLDADIAADADTSFSIFGTFHFKIHLR